MANDLNLFQCIGRLGKDPEQRFLPNGDAVCNFSLALGWKSKDKEGCEWVNVVAFKKLAEIIAQYCTKGQQVYISGKLRTRKWQDKDGNDRYSTEIVADQMQMLGGKPAENGERRESSRMATGGGGVSDSGYEDPPFNPHDDIPFANPYQWLERSL